MAQLESYLRDWVINYLKNKDTLLRTIKSIELDKDGFDFVVNFIGKLRFFLIKPTITNPEEILAILKEKECLSLIILNDKRNLDIIYDNWNKLAEHKLFNIYFINPFSTIDKKWIIYPYTHQQICDPTSLKQGLKSMFDMVEQIDQEQAEKLAK